MIIKRNKNSYSTFCICACLRQVVGAQMKITPRCKISVSSSCFFSDWLWAGSGLMPDHCCDSQAESMHSEFHSCVPCALQSKGTIQACCHVAITVTLQRNTFKFACKAPKGDVFICGVWASGNICKPFFFISFVLDHLKIWSKEKQLRVMSSARFEETFRKLFFGVVEKQTTKITVYSRVNSWK